MQDTASLKISVDTKDIKSANTELDKLSKTSGGTEKQTNQLSRSFASLSTILGTIGVAALTSQFVKIADEMKLLDARLKMVSASTAEYVSQKKELLAISKETYSSISEITTLYTKLDPALKSLGATTKDVNNITASFAKGLKLGGANTVEAASATLQFAQAMGSGVLRGEEFNAIMEASPKLAKYLADGLGVPQTALRKMAQEGELSAGRVSAALLKMTTKINEDFTQIPMTVGMATTNLKTDLMTSIEQFDKTTGATKALAETIAGLSVNLSQYGTDITTFFVATSKFINEHNEALKTTASLVGGVAVAYYGFIAGGAVVSGIRAITTATFGLRAAMIALQASSPILLAISVALGVATAAYLAHDDALEKKNYSTVNSMEALTKAHDDLLKKRKEIQSDKFALDKTQKKETAIVDAELKKIENRLNAIGTARSNNVEKAKKEAEELKKSAKTLEENAKKLAPPEKAKKEKKAEKTDEQKAAEQLIKDIAKAKKDAMEDNAQRESDLAVSIYQAQLDAEQYNNDVIAQNALDQYNLDLFYIDDLAARQSSSALAFYEMTRSETDKINEANLALWESNKGLFTEDQMQIFFTKWQESIEAIKSNMDFSASIEFDPAGLEGTAKAIAGIGKSMSQLSKAEAQYTKNKTLYAEGSAEYAKNEEDHTQNQIAGYSNMAGAMSAMFEQGSSEAKAMAVVQGALAVISAGAGGDPYTVIPRMIAAGITVAQVLGSAGISSASISAPANSGTVLGDSLSVSESTTNITDLLDSIHVSEYAELRDINRAVTSMAEGIKGAITNIFRAGVLDTSGVSLGSSIGIAEKIATKAIIGSLDGGATSKITNAIFGGSSQQSIRASGFEIGAGTLGSKQNAATLGASSYVDVETNKRGMFGSHSYSYDKQNTALDQASSQSISLIYKSFSDEMVAINKGLGTDLAPQISGYVLDAISLNMKDLSGEEAVKKLNDTFSALGDKMASDVFGTIINQYQDLGEGLLETAVRVITEKAVVIQDLGDIGKTVSGDVISISQSLVELSGSLGDFQDSVSSYYDNYFTEEERNSRTREKLLVFFGDLGYQLPEGTQAFRNMVNALDLTTMSGQEAFTSLMSVSDAFYALSSASEKNILSFTNSLLTSQELAKQSASSMGIELATTVDGLSALFNKLAYDTDGLTDSDLALIEANKELLIDTAQYTADINILNTTLGDASKNISTLDGVLGVISSTIEKLRSASRTSGQSLQIFYDAMSEAQRLSTTKDYVGYANAIKKAADASSVLMDASAFPLKRDMEYAQLVAANQFGDLQDITLTEVDYLKQIEENTRLQVIALTEAMDRLGMSISSKLSASISSTAPVATIDSSISSAYSNILGRSAETSGASYWSSQLSSGALNTASIDDEIAKAAIPEIYRTLLGREPDAAGAAYWADKLSSGQLAPDQVDDAIRAAAIANGQQIMPGFAVGTPNVPYDMIAQIHKGEAIVPKPEAEAWRNGSLVGNNNSLIAEVQSLRIAMSALLKVNNSYQEKIDKNTKPNLHLGVI